MTGVSIREQKFALRGIWRREIYRHEPVLEGQRNVGQRAGIEAGREGDAAGNEIVLPQIGNDGCDRAAGVQRGVTSQGIVDREPRSPAVPILVVRRLGVVEENLLRVVV